MKHDTLRTIYLKDYMPTPFEVLHVDLNFDLRKNTTKVRSKIQMKARSAELGKSPLVFTGSEMKLVSVKINDKLLTSSDYDLSADLLTICNLPKGKFFLEIENEIKPHENTSLEGLYLSTKNYYTQCEAEGFRKITYYYDRPDVMATFTTIVEANKMDYPVLLSNGKCVDRGDGSLGESLDDSSGERHWARWEDPFKKPCYLFALVAGDLEVLRSSYTTMSGRDINLEIYAVESDIKKCHFAMESLVNSMKWDEDTFGLECDLDNYMIVAVSDFNMGAMENKGLNIFNTSAVLADSKSAGDSSFARVEGVIGHEYFHNWTGNRVTCRDWFQLCLKEGVTVFRDQEFSSAMGSASVNRIEMVSTLRARQFSEDAGPTSHAVRPDSFVEINNFYTATIYEKGAEICRMINLELGKQGFRKGMDLYFKRHDGQAVTVEDFISAMSDANDKSLDHYLTWYLQAGTPRVKATGVYHSEDKTYTLTLRQSCPATPGQPEKKLLSIPNLMSLIDEDGREIPLRLEGEKHAVSKERLFMLVEKETTLVFADVASRPVPSLFRDFSAPIVLEADYSQQDLIFILGHDSNDFNRWNAGETLMKQTMLSLIDDRKSGKKLALSENICKAFQSILCDESLDKSFRALCLALPSSAAMAQEMKVVDVDRICDVRTFVEGALASFLESDALRLFSENDNRDAYKFDVESVGRRALKSLCLWLLRKADPASASKLLLDQMKSATNMTDEHSALTILADVRGSERQEAWNIFYEKWKQDDLVIDQWFSSQVRSWGDDTYERLIRLLEHPDFTLANPNRARSLLQAFTMNFKQFHHESGRGYRLCADYVIKTDVKNPQLASRLVHSLALWGRMDSARKALMKSELTRIHEACSLSSDTAEIVGQMLK